MNEEKRDQLEKRKQKLLSKLKVDKQVTGTINDFLYIVDILNNNKISYEIEYLTCTDEQHHSLYLDAITYSPLADYNFPIHSIKLADGFYVHEKVEKAFPSTLKLRYLPDLPHYEHSFGLRSAAFLNACDELKLSDEKVYFFYCRYSPVVKLSLKDIRQHVEAFLDTPMLSKDVCIVPLDYSWLIFGSIEDEWGWGSE